MTTPVFLPEKSHGHKSLAGYSPWGHKESDTTERVGMGVFRDLAASLKLQRLPWATRESCEPRQESVNNRRSQGRYPGAA